MTPQPRSADRPRHRRHHDDARPQAARPQAPASNDASRPALDLDATADASTTGTSTAEVASFAELGVPSQIIAALAERGVVTPFPIQAATLVDSLAGRDVLGRGKTGSGKTVAFAVPAVARLAASGTRRQPSRPRCLVLVPTRELANQVAETLTPIAAAMSLRVAVVYGGVGQGPQVTALRSGVDVLVACPGRLEDLVSQRHCHLDAVEVTVLDEADHMADLGFLPGVKRLLDRTPRGGQRLLFSATLDKGIDVLVQRYLSEPAIHSVDSAASTVTTMQHHVLKVTLADKPAVVTQLAGGLERSLLFTRTKHGAKKLAKQLTSSGVPAVELHGNLSQNARERNLEAFSTGEIRVLVATDIAARGIHVDDIALVVHVDPPAEHKAFLHRSGRTARAGAEGVVVTVMTPEQAGDVRALTRAAKIDPTITAVTPEHELLADLSGPQAPRVTPRAAPPAPSAARPTSVRRDGTAAGAQRNGYGHPGARPTGRPSGRPAARPAGRSGNGGRRGGGR